MITGGNVQFDRHMEITLTTVQVAGTSGQVPVYKGCERHLDKVKNKRLYSASIDFICKTGERRCNTFGELLGLSAY